MTPKQVQTAIDNGAQYAAKHGRTDRNRVVLSPGTIIDAAEISMSEGLVRIIDTIGAIVYVDPQAVILIANGLAPAPSSAEFEVQGGELDIQKAN